MRGYTWACFASRYQVHVPVLLSSSTIQALQAHLVQDLLGGRHDPGSLLYKSFTEFVSTFHAERAHVQRDRSDFWSKHKLLDLWHVPGTGTVRMLVHEVSLGLELDCVDLQAEPYVCLAFVELCLHHLRVSFRATYLLQGRERGAWRRSYDAKGSRGVYELPDSRLHLGVAEVPALPRKWILGREVEAPTGAETVVPGLLAYTRLREYFAYIWAFLFEHGEGSLHHEFDPDIVGGVELPVEGMIGRVLYLALI